MIITVYVSIQFIILPGAGLKGCNSTISIHSETIKITNKQRKVRKAFSKIKHAVSPKNSSHIGANAGTTKNMQNTIV